MYDVTRHLLTLGSFGNFGYCDTTEALQAGTEQRSGYAVATAMMFKRQTTGRCSMARAHCAALSGPADPGLKTKGRMLFSKQRRSGLALHLSLSPYQDFSA